MRPRRAELSWKEPVADQNDQKPEAESEAGRKQERRTRAERLLEILQLERIEENLYRGLNEARGNYRLFGGQVLSQALRAACETVTDRQAHSVHGYFMRAGNASLPVLYEVDRIRDGRSFTTRRVVAIQEGEAIFSMSVSFQVAEEGFEHAASMPNVPPPDELEDDMLVAARLAATNPEFARNMSPMAGRPRPFETRSVFEFGTPAWEENRLWNPVWIRFAAPLADADDTLNRCLLAYASDMGLVSTSLLPHAESQSRDQFQMASLDHALWIHAPVPMHEWLLFHKHTTTASGARGLVHAAFYEAGGGLLASVTQEGLVREIRAPEARQSAK